MSNDAESRRREEDELREAMKEPPLGGYTAPEEAAEDGDGPDAAGEDRGPEAATSFGEDPEEWPTPEMIEEAKRVAKWVFTADETLEPEWWMTYLLAHELGIPPWQLNDAPAPWVKIAWAKVQGLKWAREEKDRQAMEQTRLHVASANPGPGEPRGRRR